MTTTKRSPMTSWERLYGGAKAKEDDRTTTEMLYAHAARMKSAREKVTTAAHAPVDYDPLRWQTWHLLEARRQAANRRAKRVYEALLVILVVTLWAAILGLGARLAWSLMGGMGG